MPKTYTYIYVLRMATSHAADRFALTSQHYHFMTSPKQVSRSTSLGCTSLRSTSLGCTSLRSTSLECSLNGPHTVSRARLRAYILQLHRLLAPANSTCTGIQATSTVKLICPLPLLFRSVQKKQLGYREAISMHVYLAHGDWAWLDSRLLGAVWQHSFTLSYHCYGHACAAALEVVHPLSLGSVINTPHFLHTCFILVDLHPATEHGPKHTVPLAQCTHCRLEQRATHVQFDVLIRQP